ncbi:MAG: glucose-1-phosphate cytidylyltransferase [Hyphomicrobiaceae bacterium]|nr:glucose-1-phosphate cytidylyltransferase [Hyphomicrobiaceae bacterium]
MKAVILAGGFGTRISEESQTRPKPMVEIGGRPILWHIMKIFSHCGINDFIVCLGYKGYVIKEYFSNYFLHMSDVTFDLRSNSVNYHKKRAEPWSITLVETGSKTMTGGRLKRVRDYIGDQPFFFTYGDGVIDADLRAIYDFHQKSGKLATVTAVQPPGRYGSLEIADGERVTGFVEKPTGGGYINGGFFVLSPGVLDYIAGDDTPWEKEPVERLAAEGQLGAYVHKGFWHPMDTLRDRNHLDELYMGGNAPWVIWK